MLMSSNPRSAYCWWPNMKSFCSLVVQVSIFYSVHVYNILPFCGGTRIAACSYISSYLILFMLLKYLWGYHCLSWFWDSYFGNWLYFWIFFSLISMRGLLIWFFTEHKYKTTHISIHKSSSRTTKSQKSLIPTSSLDHNIGTKTVRQR